MATAGQVPGALVHDRAWIMVQGASAVPLDCHLLHIIIHGLARAQTEGGQRWSVRLLLCSVAHARSQQELKILD